MDIFETKFVNKSKGHIQFPSEIGLTDFIELEYLGANETRILQVFEPNGWMQYSQVVWKPVRNWNDQLVLAISLKPRKGFKASNLKEPKLLIDFKWDMKKDEGNPPSAHQIYQIGSEFRLSIVLNVPMIIEVPKDTFPAAYKKLVLAHEVEALIYDDNPSDNMVFNNFHTALKDRRSDKELRNLGLIKTVEKKTFHT